ncbi:hypothetical protein [Streptomyces sp. NPDC001774]
MTFEYRDEDGDELFVDRAVLIPAIFIRTPPNGCVVPSGRVEEVVAGIRDAARQAAGQAPTTERPCGSRSLPISTGEVVACVLDAGHAMQCQSATEYPYVSWPNPSNGRWNPAVEQPAEARSTDPLDPQPTVQLSYRLEHRYEGESTWRQGVPGLGLRWTYADWAKADQRLAEARQQWPQHAHRMVMITTIVAEAVVAEGTR